MRLFGPLYDWTMRAARHPRAVPLLVLVAACEAVFFPVPVVLMLLPVAAARPDAAWRLAGLTTLGSVAGGLAGYLLGHWLIDALLPWIEAAGHAETYRTACEWFLRWGFWVLFLAGFSPIPYKIFTIAAGSLHMALAPFLLASLVGRAGQFYLAAALVRAFGPRGLPWVERHVERIGWATLAAAVVAYFLLR
ncbi:MAG: hypothetical protein KatS3mg121_0400 [Gammaproteobacteria bacterium]|nr:MAG: hypothetical protein KatS3mg121_0400 [Gammaproteobacteria bacterium]